MIAVKCALLGSAALIALGLATGPAVAATTTGQILNTPVDVGTPPAENQEAAKKAAAAAPTMGQVLNTPIDVGEPPGEMKEAAKKTAAAAPTTGEVLNTPVDKSGS
jgi:hypothetical protein